MKKTSKLILLLLCLFFSVAIVFYGCKAEATGSTPTEILQKYLEAIDQVDYTTAYQYLASADRTLKTEDDYKRYCERNSDFISDNINKEAAKSIVYTFDAPVVIDRTKVQIEAHENTIDFIKIQEKIPLKTIIDEFNTTGKNILKDFTAFYFDKVREKYGEALPKITSDRKFTLLKENGEWRVFEDIATELKIDDYYADAVAKDKEDSYEIALADCDKILALVPENQNIIKLKEKITKEIADKQVRDAYIAQYLKIDDVKWGFVFRYPFNYLEVKGTLVNRGNRPLKEVLVRLQCIDKEGKIIYEENFWPISVSGETENSYKGVLKAGGYNLALDYFELNTGSFAPTTKITFEVTYIVFGD